jgi:hypothetical protein
MVDKAPVLVLVSVHRALAAVVDIPLAYQIGYNVLDKYVH